MMLDPLRRYCRNLTGFIISKPPFVVFCVFLCFLAIALFCLGYYVIDNEIVDPEAEKDWNDFLTGLSDTRFCVHSKFTTDVGQNAQATNETMKSGIFPYGFTSSNGLQQISIPLKIGVHIQAKAHYLHGNITHLTTVMDTPFHRSGVVKRKMNLTFSLSEIWNTEKKCKEGNKCRLPEGFFHSCVTIMAPRAVLPEWRPETCNSSHIGVMMSMKALTQKAWLSNSCKSGAIIYFKHPVDLEIREKLSVDERAKANLHLQVSSYFLFILVISSIIYGMIKGKPLKSKKVSFEASGL